MSVATESLLETLPRAPYPGLRPFDLSDWPILFGREEMIDAVVQMLGRQRVLVVHGSSGSGKSSLIRAGVLPRLVRQHLRHQVPWRSCVMRPSGGPLWNLAAALAGVDAVSPAIERIDELRQAFDQRGVSLNRIVAKLVDPNGQRVCILIDQFEEIFRYAKESSHEEVELLIELLEGLLDDDDESARVHVVITMRSEFLGDCARFDGLARAINRSQYLLPRMDHAALTRAICRPAELYGGKVSYKLAERLIADAGRGQDVLPLIQHGLAVLWRKAAETSEHPSLDLQQYEATRGLELMLSDHADSVVRSLLPDPDAEARRVFEKRDERSLGRIGGAFEFLRFEGRELLVGLAERVFDYFEPVLKPPAPGTETSEDQSDLRATGAEASTLEKMVGQLKVILAKVVSPIAAFVMKLDASEFVPDLPTSIERLFRSLTDINSEGQAIRRPQRLSALVGVTATPQDTLVSVLNSFRAEGVSFITPYAPAPISEDTVVDISHEALIRCWAEIADANTGWLQREFQDGLTWRTLLARARDGDVLPPTVFEERKSWMKTLTPDWSNRYGGEWESVEQFMRVCRRQRTAERISTIVGLAIFGFFATAVVSVFLLMVAAFAESLFSAVAEFLDSSL